ncbi:MAG: histidine-type phosphatase [Selenomonadaceae bacterium]|nr:histidine-type phosphatase [Selenomonadaceae bacterium]
MKKFLALIIVFVVAVTFFSVAHAMDYQLEQVVVISRHNLRNSLKAGDDRGLLTLRGGEMETLMGQYFEARLREQSLFPKNAQPSVGEVRFYANSYQRTIATAKYFSAGAFPIANIPIEYHRALGQKDRVFLSPADPALEKLLASEVDWKKLLNSLRKEIATVERLSGEKLNPADFYQMKLGSEAAEWKAQGTAKTINVAADALLMDYYDGKVSYSDAEMRDVAKISSMMINSNFDRPIGAKVFASPMLAVISDELKTPGRKFSFICGHDSNLSNVLTAIGVEDYVLPGTIEWRVPIASKVVIEKIRGTDGNEYARLSFVYPSSAQIVNREMLNLDNPPMKVPLKLRGLQTVDSDATYKLSDVLQRLSDAQIVDGRRVA